MITAHMPLSSLTPGPPETSSSRSESLLSRFSNPLSKRGRNNFDFSIELDEDFKAYGPGETVKGQVVLSVLKGFDITHLVIALHGFAKVFKHQQEKVRSFPELVNNQGTRGFEYHGNGLASLFQDEHTLCGSGFLRKQVYKFGFELQFPLRGLPSTIDFERGTVAYMVSATITRPTTIAPTMTRTQAVKFRDHIDIESLYTPKVRVISLEPIRHRGKMKKVKTSSTVSTQDTLSSRNTLSRRSTQNSIPTGSPAPVIPPLSPAPSEDTVATHVTTSTGSLQIVESSSPTRKASPQTSETRSNLTSTSAQTITAVTELPRYGALAGDVVPIKVSVTHNKPHARGVIIATLYRLGRIDMHPILPLASKGKEKKMEYEDVYPKSRTGLSGLYFSSSAPSSVFRKDLSQSSTMMIVNPQTMMAEVRTSVKVPDDAFPSISNVPGGMISFTYHIEVVIDLNGKLGETRFFPSLTSNGPTFSTGADNGNQISSDWAHSILDTTSLRRTKSVVTFELPLVVGTRDSRRTRMQPSAKHPLDFDTKWTGTEPMNGWHNGHDGYDGHDGHYGPELYEDESYDGWYHDEFGDPVYDGYYGSEYGYENGYGHDQAAFPPPALLPPPTQPEQLDEKARLRRQEELLMPSQPPGTGESSSSAQVFVPTAPNFEAEDSSAPSDGHLTNGRPPTHPMISRASARSTETIVLSQDSPPPHLAVDQHIPQTEDKQELERQRLMADASAPPIEAEAGSSAEPARSNAPAASAPVINEDEEYLSRVLHHDHTDFERLPQYQR